MAVLAPRHRVRGLAGAALSCLAALITLAGPARRASPRDGGGEPWPVGVPRAIAVRAGAARVVVPSRSASDRTLVVVSALARTPGAYPFRISARPADRPEPPVQCDDGPRRSPRLGATRPAMTVETRRGMANPASERVFYLPVRDGDATSPGTYRPVESRLQGLGRSVQVYVDLADLSGVDEATVRDIVTTFDDLVLPLVLRNIGAARDVDGDGRFTVLLSGWLGHLADGKLAVDGFVRGADFDPRQRPPLGNRCDMMCLNASLRSGPHLRTVLAHEYTHAVTYCLKALGPASVDEEGWLDEALAHLTEDLHGFSRSNLDYRVEAFLAAPERYRLLVEDYGSADLIRSHGHRGSAYRFLRWCADESGPGLLGALVRSDLRGVPNLEAATGRTFAALYRGWSVGTFLDAIGPGGPSESALPPFASRITPGGDDDLVTLDGTASHFALVEGSASGAVTIDVAGPPEAEVQVTVVRLPGDYPRLDLNVGIEPAADGSPGLKARIRERDGRAVTLQSLHWSPAVPPTDPAARARRSGTLSGDALREAFGRDSLSPHGRLASKPIPLGPARPADGPLVVTAVGLDRAGRRVVARAELEQTPARRED